MSKPKAQAKSQPAAKKVSVPTFVTFLLDRSKSMDDIKSQTIEGFNAYVGGLQEDKNAGIRFTFLQFDSISLDKVQVDVPIAEAKNLTNETFQPRSGTPLIDAAYKTIMAVEEAVSRQETKPKVVICIQTDGDENQSREYTWANLSTLVKAKQEMGWQFNFIGAGIDAYKQAGLMGVSAMNTMSYGKGMAHTMSAFRASANNTASFAGGQSISTSYNMGQRQDSGDNFIPDELKDKLTGGTSKAGK